MKQLTIAITANREEVSYSVMDNDGNSWSDTMKSTVRGALHGMNTVHVEDLPWLSTEMAYVVDEILNQADELAGAIFTADEEEVE